MSSIPFNSIQFDEAEGSVKQKDVIRGLLDQRSRLISFARAIVRDEHDAEDVFQEVMVLAAEKHHEIDRSDGLISWALTATRYRSLHVVRKRKRDRVELSPGALDQLEACWRDASGEPAQDMSQALLHCLDTLSPYSREIVGLRYGQGLQGKQVAQQLNRKPQTIYMALTRIHNALRDCIRLRLAGGGQ